MCHVLIIEDEILIALDLQDLQDLLEAHGAKTFAFASSEAEAIRAANDRNPDFITSDVALEKGTGPRAVQVIRQEIGPIPVIFITGTPEACDPCPPSARILGKPLSFPAIISAFQEMAPISQ